MTRAVHKEVPKTGRGTNIRLAFALFAGPVAWTAHQLVGVAVTGRACTGATLAAWQWTVLWVVTATAVGLTVAGIGVAYRAFRGWNRDTPVSHAEGWDRVEFLSLLAMFIGGYLLLNIIYFGIMPLLVDPCIASY